MSDIDMSITSTKQKDRVQYSDEIIIAKKEARTMKITCNTTKETKDVLDKFCSKNGISLSDLGHQLFTNFAKNCK